MGRPLVVDVSIIVPHYNDLASLEICLAALARQDFFGGSVEIIVADNRSPQTLEAVAGAAGPAARVVDAPEPGAGPARNAGVAASSGAILAFTDCDCIPEPGWLAAGIAALERGDVAGGRMTVAVADESAMTGAEAFERVFAFNNRRYVEEKGFSVTANLFCRRETFDAVGPFRTGVSEDFEWCRRARAAGYSLVYAGDAVVAHPARRNWSQLKRKWSRLNRESFGIAREKPLGRLRWLGTTLALPASILAHMPRVVRSPALPDGRSRLAALGTLARLRLWRTGDALALGLGLRR